MRGQDRRSTTSSRSSASCATRFGGSKTFEANRPPRPTGYIGKWFAPRAAAELVFFRSFVDEYEHADVLRVVLARAARSARRTTHFDLDFPREPQRRASTGATSTRRSAARSTAPSTSCAATRSTRSRGSVSSRACARADARLVVLHGDARELELPGPFDGVVTSPPYPGLIDYHEQHRYAYELLGLDDQPRARARRGRAGREREGDPRLRRRHRGGARQRARRATAARAGRDRDQRPPRALPGDPRARRARRSRRATGATSTGEPGAAPASSSRT